MNKKFFFYVAITTMLATVVTACNNDGSNDDDVPVTDIRLNQTTVTLMVGDTLSLIATVIPTNANNKNVAWTSNDTTVAIVSNGMVIALSKGMTSIKVATEDDSRFAFCYVDVGTRVRSLTLNSTIDTLYPHRWLTLSATVFPSDALNSELKWTSSNTAIATVTVDNTSAWYGRNSCEVATISEGTTTITAATVDGSKTASCTLTIISVPNMTLGGIIWASANVDDFQTFAVRPDMYTKFYQWNRKKAWTAIGNNGMNITGWTGATSIADSAWNINPCPEGWRLPTHTELQMLYNAGASYAYKWMRGNAVAGCYYGPNHATCSLNNNMEGCVFLPSCGDIVASDGLAWLTGQGNGGAYWSSTEEGSAHGRVLYFSIQSNSPNYSDFKTSGVSIRCVKCL